ncbi:unnamed protein product [Boreogadus saida]
MRALVKPRGQPTARAESRLPSQTAKREPSGAFKCLVSTERVHRRQYPHEVSGAPELSSVGIADGDKADTPAENLRSPRPITSLLHKGSKSVA